MLIIINIIGVCWRQREIHLFIVCQAISDRTCMRDVYIRNGFEMAQLLWKKTHSGKSGRHSVSKTMTSLTQWICIPFRIRTIYCLLLLLTCTAASVSVSAGRSDDLSIWRFVNNNILNASNIKSRVSNVQKQSINLTQANTSTHADDTHDTTIQCYRCRSAWNWGFNW